MPRIAAEPTKNVNFRMPAELLKEIDSLAKTNHRERTSEINCACRRWTESGGRTMDTPLDTEIENLKAAISGARRRNRRSASGNRRTESDNNNLSDELKNERTAMLDIMAKDKTIITCLCSGMLGQMKETPVLIKPKAGEK